jgi:hypothetical protein
MSKIICTDLNLASIEEDPSSPKRAKNLTWRRDPGESFSDWTIIVKQHASEDKGVATPSPKTYHVHKCVVGAGPRSSDYFLKVFQNTELEESKTSTSVLKLEASAAEAFPAMLDFIYKLPAGISVTSKKAVTFRVTSKKAVTFRHLASYFRVPALSRGMKKIIEVDMKPSNICDYLKEAQLYQDDEIIRATMEVAADNWLSVFAPIKTLKHASSQSLYFRLLPQKKQLEVMQLALQRAGSAYRSFKRVPSKDTEWKQDGGVLVWKKHCSVLQRNGGMAMKYKQAFKHGGRRTAQVASLDLYFDDNDEACNNTVCENSESDFSENGIG